MSRWLGLIGFALLWALPGLAQPAVGVTPGLLAPDFQLPVVAPPDQELFQLSATRGQVVVLVFWFFNCLPCRAEAPFFSMALERYGARGLQVVGVNRGDGEAQIQAFADLFHARYPLLADPGNVVNDRYLVVGFPTTIFIARDGVIAERVVGLETTNEAEFAQRLEERLAGLLGAPGQGSGGQAL
ncbi:MAG: TlpA family protein disulfide reductase [Deinococcus sp.]|nr:TlpA family protein disulfide reductase [Deinococcus sp.]